MQFESLWVASRTVDACRRVFNGCLICLRGGPSRSAPLGFNCPGNTVLHSGVLSMRSHLGLLPQCLFIVRSRTKVNSLEESCVSRAAQHPLWIGSGPTLPQSEH